MATFFPEIGPAQDVSPRDGIRFSLAEVKAFVGGYIELVSIRPPDDMPPDQTMMFCNEDGHRLGLSLNHRATRLYRGDPPRHDGVIVGPAIVMTPREAGED